MLGSSVSQISKQSGLSSQTILRIIYWYLDHPPKAHPTPNPHCHLILDGTWFGKGCCLLVYWDHELEKTQHWHYTDGETAEEIAQDLEELENQEVIMVSATSDGGTGIKKAIQKVHPGIPHQRCLVHLRRQALAWITQNPKTPAGWQIKPIVEKLYLVRNHQQRQLWVKAFEGWCYRWEEFLKQRSYSSGNHKWWYTHKQLRRVRSLIKNALPNLFHYLDDETIPKTTNGLEGRFSSLKQHYRQHRGLSGKRRKAYLEWYLSVVVNGELPTRSVN